MIYCSYQQPSMHLPEITLTARFSPLLCVAIPTEIPRNRRRLRLVALG